MFWIIALAALICAYFYPVVGLVGGIGIMLFADKLFRTGGDYDFGPVIPFLGGMGLTLVSLMILIVRFFG